MVIEEPCLNLGGLLRDKWPLQVDTMSQPELQLYQHRTFNADVKGFITAAQDIAEPSPRALAQENRLVGEEKKFDVYKKAPWVGGNHVLKKMQHSPRVGDEW